MSTQSDQMISLMEQNNIKLDMKQVSQFIKYYEMLVETNKVMNLTAITEFDEVIVKHFADSLTLSRVCDLNKPLSIIDIGTGAGFPGIPLKIAFPKLKVTLLDSLNKRVGFLNQVIETLELEDIQAIHSRAEDAGRDKAHREKYDLCVSRAVANLSTLSEYCLPFVHIGGAFVSYKSQKASEEIDAAKRAIKILGGLVKQCDTFNLSDSDMERSLVVIEKIKTTGKSYPRKAGKPSKEPL